MTPGEEIPVEVDMWGRESRRPDWRTDWPFHIALAVVLIVTAAFPDHYSPLLWLVPVWGLSYVVCFWGYVIRGRRWVGWLFVAVMLAVVLVLDRAGLGAYQYFVAFPLIWLFTGSRTEGMVGTVCYGVGMFAVMMAEASHQGRARQDLGQAAAVSAGAVAFSAFMALWIMRISSLSGRHRELAATLAHTVVELEEARAELAASERERGRSEERVRMAGEIHDTLAQDFTSIAMVVQTARLPGADLGRSLDLVEQTAREGLAQSRRLIAESQPPLDLAASIRRIGQSMAARTGVEVTVETGPWQPVGARSEVVLLRCVQEALHNVEKHAHANRVDVRLAREPGLARLDVHDDGIGLDPRRPAGFGLTTMRRRVETERGRLDIESGSGGGTRLHVELPLDGTL